VWFVPVGLALWALLTGSPAVQVEGALLPITRFLETKVAALAAADVAFLG
jgi:hypothetical protein